MIFNFSEKEKTLIFNSEHNGTEYFASMVNEKDIKFIGSLMPERTSFNQYVHIDIDKYLETYHGVSVSRISLEWLKQLFHYIR